MKKLYVLLTLLLSTSGYAGVLQDADFKSEAELISAGANASYLLNDTKIYDTLRAQKLSVTLGQAVTTSAVPSNGQLLIGNGTDFSVNSLTAGSGISIVPGAGSITISATGTSGTTTVGTIDSQAKSANGLVISGVNLYAQTADGTYPGLVSAGAQSFAGAKTFLAAPVMDSLTASRPLKLDAGKALTAGYIVNADIDAAAAIDASKIADGSVSSAEFQYLGSVTSDIQTQLNGKQAAFTWAQETPSGLVNGSNVTYVLAHVPSAAKSVEVFVNGLMKSQGAGEDYTIASDTITMAVAPVVGQKIWVKYTY